VTWLWTLAATLTEPFVDPGSRTWLGSLVAAAVVAAGVVAWTHRDAPLSALRTGLGRTWHSLRHKSSVLDIQLLLLRQLLRALGVLPGVAAALWLSTWAVRGLDAGLGRPEVLGLPVQSVPVWLVGLAYTVVLFVAWDLSRFLLHLAMHRVPALWELHQVHHSASVLTPLTFHRLHPLESVLYTARGVVVTSLVLAPTWWLFRDAATVWTVLGVHALGFGFNVLTGNLRHSHLWLRFGRLEGWLVSPAQHQLHHSADAADQHCNLGTWLAIWDRLAGTHRAAPAAPPAHFGVQERNHGDDVITALVGPVRSWLRRRPAGSLTAASAVAIGLLTVPAEPASAQEPPAPDATPDDAAEDTDADTDDALDDEMVVVVETEGGMPRVAGSAQVIPEEELERFEMDDVGRVLVTVPGVYVRGEDGLGLRPNIGLRGANSNRSAKITLLEDGIPFAPAPYAAPAAYYFPLTTRMTAIDVIKGPAAIQHGPNTVGGAVNLRTRSVPTDGLHAGADLAAGSYTSGKAHLWAGGGDARGGWLVEGVHLGTRGFWEPDHDGPVGTQRTELMAKGRVVLRDDAEQRDALELKLGFAREDSRSTYLGLHPDDYEDAPWRRYVVTSDARMQWTRSQINLSYLHRTRGAVQLRITAYRHQLHRSWRKFNAFADGPDAYKVLTSPDAGSNATWLALLRGQADSLTPSEQLLIGTNDRRFVASGVSGTARFIARDAPTGPTFRGEVGLRVHHDDVARLHTEDRYTVTDGALQATDAPTETTRDDVSRALAFSAHTAWDVGLGDVHVEPGLRTEVIRTWRVGEGKPQLRVHPLPGLGLRWQPSPNLAVFGGAYRGFSPVAPGQSPDAQPETAWNGELGVRGHRGTSQGELTAFVSDYRNLTGTCTFSAGCADDQIGDQFNAGRVRAVGLEAAASSDVDLGRGWTLPLGAAYTFTHATFGTTFQSGFPQYGSVRAGDFLPYLPVHQGSARLGLAHHRLTLDATVEATGAQLDIAGPLEQPQVPARALVHASTSVRLYREIRLYSTLQNALGSDAVASLRPLGPRPVGRRTLWLGLKAGF